MTTNICWRLCSIFVAQKSSHPLESGEYSLTIGDLAMDPPPPPSSLALKGDVNGDGKVGRSTVRWKEVEG